MKLFWPCVLVQTCAILFLQQCLAVVLPPTHVMQMTIRDLNRILEKRQIHYFEADQSYRTLCRLGYDVTRLRIIATHFRQLRSLRKDFPDDTIIEDHFIYESDRMKGFSRDVDRINQLTNNGLYYKYDSVKERTFDDLAGFIMDEIEIWRQRLAARALDIK